MAILWGPAHMTPPFTRKYSRLLPPKARLAAIKIFSLKTG